MAKKKTEDTEVGDDFDFDDLEDLDADISFDDEDSVDSDSREPSRIKVASELAKDAGEGFFDSLIKSSAQNVLPDGFENGYYAASELADYGKDVLDKNKQKVTKSVYRLGKEVKKILPFKVGLLERFLESSESDFETQRTQSEEEMRSAAISSELSSIFDRQLEAQTQLAARQEATEEVAQRERIVQTKLSADVLASIDRSTSRQTAFTTQITKEYYRKSLELQFKSYFVQADMLKTMKEHYKGFSIQFSDIQRNTALPEFVKLKNTERLQDMLRDQAVTSVYEQMFTNSKFMQNFKAKTERYISEKVSGVTDLVDTFTDMFAGVNDMSDGNGGKMMAGMGANFGGSVLGDFVANKIPEDVRKRIKENKVVKTTGNYLSVLASSPSTLFSTIRDKLKTKSQQLEEDPSASGQLLGKVTSGLSDIFDTVTPDRPNLGIKQKDYLSHNQPAIFDNNVHRSITEVIPMYLAKLLAKSTDLNTMYRAANVDKTRRITDSDSLQYDYKNRKLDTADNIRASVEESVFTTKATKPKSKRSASSLLAATQSTISKDTNLSKTAKSLKLSSIKSKATEDALTEYLDRAKRTLGDDTSFETLIDNAESNEKLKKIMTEIPGIQHVIKTIKEAQLQNKQQFTNEIQDSMRAYPIEAVKQLVSMASRIAKTSPVNAIPDNAAEALAKALATYILKTGQDITIQGLLSQSALKYLQEDDIAKHKTLKPTLTVLLSDIQRIQSSEDHDLTSSLLILFSALNTSLKTSMEITPQAYQALAELYPSIAPKKELDIEQIAEGRLSQSKKTYVSIETLKSFKLVNKDDVKAAREITAVESLISRVTSKTTIFAKTNADELRATGGNPFKVAELAIRKATQAKSSATEALQRSKEALTQKGQELSDYLSDKTDSFTAEMLTNTAAKLDSYQQSIQQRIAALQAEYVMKEQQFNEAKQVINDVDTSNKIAKLAETEAKLYKATTTANIKALQQLNLEISQLRDSVRSLSQSTEALPVTERVKAMKTLFSDKVKRMSDLLSQHELQIDRLTSTT